MKKVLISATLLIGMVASAVVFSSFTTPKENSEVLDTQISVQGDWREVGRYKGYDANGRSSSWDFVIWEKEGMCGAYYWTYNNLITGVYNPDQVSEDKHQRRGGKLMQNSEKKWYASLDGKQYFINF
ncbi:MAG: hypothetical protein IJ767_02855 [Bacteroidaceae bacterium]|nr:hypothetical protein [Bacteroidaceae bacterium]